MTRIRTVSLFALAIAVLLVTTWDSQAAWRRGRCRSGGCSAGGRTGFFAPAPQVAGCQGCGQAGCAAFDGCAPGCPNGQCVPQSFRPFVPNSIPQLLPSAFGCPNGQCPIPR